MVWLTWDTTLLRHHRKNEYVFISQSVNFDLIIENQISINYFENADK
jgi:hypothetical protein